MSTAVPGPTPTGPVPPTRSRLNTTALTEPVGRDQVRAFRADTKAAQRANPGISTGLETTTSFTGIVGIAAIGLFFIVIFGDLISGFARGEGLDTILLVACLLALVIGFVVFRSVFGLGGNWAKWMRLTGFARDNGLQYLSEQPDPMLPGCIFQVGSSRGAYDYLMTTSGRSVDFGNYRYTTGNGKNSTTHRWGFLAMRLDRRLPNMVLDSKANNGLFGGTNLPETFDRSQVLHLEGDFDKYFTLYCPNEYEQDALYVFTPDLMVLLIDDAAPFDVEIVDDWMFVYSATPFQPLAAATYQRLFTIVATVGAKAVTQTQRYHDDRVTTPGANIVAPQGQRLRHGLSLSTIVVTVIIGAIFIYNLVSAH
jgi:hypothetical protein